jgi:hypothetical protein
VNTPTAHGPGSSGDAEAATFGFVVVALAPWDDEDDEMYVVGSTGPFVTHADADAWVVRNRARMCEFSIVEVIAPGTAVMFPDTAAPLHL